MAPGEFRLRVCYGKRGRLRYLSHLELVRALERAARRAELPYAVTKGFNPHMKIAFGPALPVGTAGMREYMDLWLREYVPAETIVDRLGAVVTPELRPVEARYVAEGAPSLSAECTLGVYEVVIGGTVGEDQVRAALEALTRDGGLTVRRKNKDKFFDLASCLPKEPQVRSSGADVIVEVVTKMGPEGSLRPEVFVSEALKRSDISGAVTLVTRIDTLVEEDGVMRRPL